MVDLETAERSRLILTELREQLADVLKIRLLGARTSSG